MLLTRTESGLYCPAGDFFVDPWQPVDRAVVTHAHADHARPGSRSYLAAREGEHVLRLRLGDAAIVETADYGQPVTIGGVTVSFYPAGHILGSAQVRVEHQGEVWVVSGDYKLEADPTCTPFQVVPCHTFITEATFGLPVYRWPEQQDVVDEINAWWRANQAEGKASVLFAYTLGKAQRIAASVDATIGHIYVHGAVHSLNQAYWQSGVRLPNMIYASEAPAGTDWSQALIIAPPSAQSTAWLRRFGRLSTGFASGWMRVRGQRRRRSVDRGFVLSDHADWPGLMQVIQETGAGRVLVTHGYVPPVVRWLREQGLEAYALETRFEGEQEELEV
ncbi:MAG TPA: ligase-associated DNA damage response exonuclease [Anaerolineae bacterium]